MDIYVGNLSYDVDEEELRKTFETHGTVDSVRIVRDRFTGRHRGFGFVEMSVKEEGDAAIGALNGQELLGRSMRVNEARGRAGEGGGGGAAGGGGGGGRGPRF